MQFFFLGGGGSVRGDVQVANGTGSSLVALRHVLLSQIRWRRLCDEPKERHRGKLKTLEIYWDLNYYPWAGAHNPFRFMGSCLGLFCLKARLALL